MKKILFAILCCLPIAAFAQWSIVPSGSVGMSNYRLDYKEISDFKPAVGFSGDVSVRYSIPYSYFYFSLGAGYLSYQSDNDAVYPSHEVEPNPRYPYAYLDENLSALYIPLTVGFYLPDKKFSPIAEAGGQLNVVLDTGDFTRASGYADKSTMWAFMVGAGVRYKLYKNNALEVKFRYSLSTDMIDYAVNNGWSYFSLNVGYAFKL